MFESMGLLLRQTFREVPALKSRDASRRGWAYGEVATDEGPVSR
ncbi:hypothetical protein HMPREF0724_11896 [Prescottella equi ATCC 33707]|uniref:Uncharacterized protein n=1 Tax=Prescottella equi ATCC 33707 TaxID=525370 RepID=F1TJ23_RHOHA|nr:hypothetical protein HMPREF0724_11896 [Prescottella equi ATCC 33707]